MVDDFRASWAAAGGAAVTPFIFVQLACWPLGNTGVLDAFRYMQASIASEPRTGMVVTADACDPAGAFHPIHPPFKQEVARRAFLWADAEIYGNTSSPRAGPVLTQSAWDAWEPSWCVCRAPRRAHSLAPAAATLTNPKSDRAPPRPLFNRGDYHYGTGSGSYVCGSGGQFTCGGVRLTFDRPVALNAFYTPASARAGPYGFARGAASGFTVARNNTWEQPVVLSGISADGLTVQLNVTYIGPSTALGSELRYAFADYPSAMPLIDAASGLPVAPFNTTLARFPPRPTTGTCTTMPDTDGTSGGVAVPGSSLAECCAACWADDRCAAAAFVAAAPTECWLKFAGGSAPKAGTSLCVIDF